MRVYGKDKGGSRKVAKKKKYGRVMPDSPVRNGGGRTALSGVGSRNQIFLVWQMFDYKISILICIVSYLKV